MLQHCSPENQIYELLYVIWDLKKLDMFYILFILEYSYQVMFIKEEDASSEDICTTSVVREVPTDNIFEEVEDVSRTLLSLFCTLT